MKGHRNRKEEMVLDNFYNSRILAVIREFEGLTVQEANIVLGFKWNKWVSKRMNQLECEGLIEKREITRPRIVWADLGFNLYYGDVSKVRYGEKNSTISRYVIKKAPIDYLLDNTAYFSETKAGLKKKLSAPMLIAGKKRYWSKEMIDIMLDEWSEVDRAALKEKIREAYVDARLGKETRTLLSYLSLFLNVLRAVFNERINYALVAEDKGWLKRLKEQRGFSFTDSELFALEEIYEEYSQKHWEENFSDFLRDQEMFRLLRLAMSPLEKRKSLLECSPVLMPSS